MAKKTTDIDRIFQLQMTTAGEQQAAMAEAEQQGDQIVWQRPDLNGWDGKLDDLEGMRKPFDRKAVNQAFVDAVKDGSGVTGDMVGTVSQLELLSCMERAFRARHTHGFSRSIALADGRHAGAGMTEARSGTLFTSSVEYIRNIYKGLK